MKFLKAFNALIVGLLFVLTFSIIAVNYTSFPLLPTVGVMGVFTLLVSLGQKAENGVLSAGTIYKQVWTGEVFQFLSTLTKNTWLARIKDYSKYVGAVDNEVQAINYALMNVLPDVLINFDFSTNVGVADLAISPGLITLDKFITKASPITDDEKYASSVKKMELVRAAHAEAILIALLKKSIHNLAPASNTTKMPVLVTSGEAHETTGRIRMRKKDLNILKEACDDLGIEEESRLLALTNEHVNDLIWEDDKFEARYYNKDNGKLQGYLLGFQLDNYSGNPYYAVAGKTRVSFGAVPDPALHTRGSVLFNVNGAAKAMGWTKVYLDEPDTQTQRSLINFRQYGIVVPVAEEQRAAIISGLS